MESVQAIASNFSKPFGYENCDREQIHLLGHIQSHGILIGINELDLTIAQISDNTIDFFNIPASSLIEKPLSTLFPKSQIDTLVSFLARKDLEIFNPITITVQIEEKKYLFQGVMHRSDGLLILELELLSTGIDSSLGFYHFARSATANVRQANSFTEMSDLLAQEIRKITQCDRVMLYRFEPDHSGIVIAEAKDEQIESFLGLHFPAADIPELARKLYYKNWLRQIIDVNSHPVPIVPLNNPITQEPIDLSFSTLRSVSLGHIKYLQKMGVSASFSISLINAGKLWGLIVCHHFSPRYIDYEARKACEFLAQVMSIEIVSRYEQELKNAQEKVKIVQAKIKQNILKPHQSINDIFSQNAEDLLNLVNAQGVVIYLSDRISEIGICPSQKFISSLILWLETKSEDVFHTNCLSYLYPEAIAIKDIASGILAISISLNHTSYHIIWFRSEVIQTVNWAGDPNKLALDDEWELTPQRSFELWKETVKAKSLPWDEVAIETASELRSTLMLAALELSQQALRLEAERAQVASQAKTSFLARMSHELRTPLNAILGCTQLMHLDNSLTQAIGEYVNIISYSSEHLLCLIDDILEMSKIEAGKIILNENQFDLHLFLHNLREMMQIQAKDKNLQLIFAVHPNSPQYIKADERKLRQILLNLMGNAIKFTDKGYVLLRVSLMDKEDESSKAIIHFELEDSGIGIAPEEIDNLFEAFVQTSSGKESQTGTGLGLAISQQFAHCMGSHISASSFLNKGTIFQFDIEVEVEVEQLSDVEIETSQIAISVQPAIEITEAPSKQEVSNSLRILLAEDTTYNQMIALKFLEKLGYQADLAVNGLEVLKALEHKFYDLILMDIQMPEMDGLEATRRIRLKEKETMAINKVKIVAMTANTMAEDRENCILNGMDDFIGKPIKIDELDAVLQKFSSKQTAINR
ncbi:phytochrome, two-component sensor histidine kinase [Pseudanabaena sp. lw0831]|uniref:response regulator n=1 Tax=Pseudanabaena sp. lw0831 TaxID=1357935 RepID=UPI0019159EFE|nr:response regulator [Pseudanabaena sp. lw0831]GBO56776.1 phytochrome, two-component sensor histidine kinase [Pseudanabaena sp. lw0831]